MNTRSIKSRFLGTALAAALTAGVGSLAPTAAQAAQAPAVKPTTQTNIAKGTGRMVRLPNTMSDLFVADPSIADVQVRSANQIYIFGKGAGETTVYATNKAGKVVYSTNVRVGTNIDSVDSIIRLAMPESKINATPMNGVVLLTGTVAAPEDIEEAGRIVQAYVGPETKIISRLKTATPLQVMLKVRFAEVSRTLAKDIGINLLTRDRDMPGNGFLFGIGRGNAGKITYITEDGDVSGLPKGSTAYDINNAVGKTTLGFAGHMLGIDILSTIDLAESDGRATILAEPTLVALSGETASFLAGGEFPIPVSQSLGSVTIEYKNYGVGLAFTPTVLADGRISMRVRPEVSELSDQGSIQMNNFTVPALTTRRAETTVELGSGQSFVIGGLLRNTSGNSTDKAPWLGDLPILGMLFRSNSFKRQETELMIVVTPYLVRPVSDSQIALPTDGYRTSNDAKRVIMDLQHSSRSGEPRPGPVVGSPQAVAPGIGPGATLDPAASPAPADGNKTKATAAASTGATPGFSL